MAARMAVEGGAANATHDAIIAKALKIMESRLRY